MSWPRQEPPFFTVWPVGMQDALAAVEPSEGPDAAPRATLERVAELVKDMNRTKHLQVKMLCQKGTKESKDGRARLIT